MLINVSAACHIIIIPPPKEKEEAEVTTDVPYCGIHLGCGPVGKECYSNVERKHSRISAVAMLTFFFHLEKTNRQSNLTVQLPGDVRDKPIVYPC